MSVSRLVQLGFVFSLIGGIITGRGVLVQLNVETGVPINEIKPLVLSDIVFFIAVVNPRTSKFIRRGMSESTLLQFLYVRGKEEEWEKGKKKETERRKKKRQGGDTNTGTGVGGVGSVGEGRKGRRKKTKEERRKKKRQGGGADARVGGVGKSG